jgi:hypothetical protein
MGNESLAARPGKKTTDRKRTEAALAGVKNQNQNRRVESSDPNQNKRPREETKLDFSIKIQHDSYTAEVTALPPSF